MKSLFLLPLLGAGFLFNLPFVQEKAVRVTGDDWTACVEQYDVKWGDTDCSQCHSFADTYKVMLRNKCTDAIDLKCCVQESNKQWRCFAWYEITAGDTVAPYACKGTGKYIWWSRKAGDLGTPFPTNDEVNRDYAE